MKINYTNLCETFIKYSIQTRKNGLLDLEKELSNIMPNLKSSKRRFNPLFFGIYQIVYGIESNDLYDLLMTLCEVNHKDLLTYQIIATGCVGLKEGITPLRLLTKLAVLIPEKIREKENFEKLYSIYFPEEVNLY
jgi:flagellar motor component MotA